MATAAWACSALRPRPKGELAHTVGLQADGRPDRFAQDGGGIFFGDFFDFHAARQRWP